jgi:hypothetical protein
MKIEDRLNKIAAELDDIAAVLELAGFDETAKKLDEAQDITDDIASGFGELSFQFRHLQRDGRPPALVPRRSKSTKPKNSKVVALKPEKQRRVA